jgi:putative transposase
MKRAGTYYKLFYHYIWATRDRLPLITPVVEPIVFNHLNAKCIEHGYKLHALNGTTDHIHLLIELKPTQLVADVAKNLKGSSAHFINKESTLPDTLYWQDGYGVVTLRQGEVSSVVAYIQYQKEHHRMGKLSDVLEICNET